MADNETGNNDTDTVDQKGDDELFSPPGYNESFNISSPATRSEHTGGDI